MIGHSTRRGADKKPTRALPRISSLPAFDWAHHRELSVVELPYPFGPYQTDLGRPGLGPTERPIVGIAGRSFLIWL